MSKNPLLNRSALNRSSLGRLAVVTMALTGLSFASSAQDSDKYVESVRKCTLIENDVVRLACFDKAASWLMINKGRSNSVASNQRSRDTGSSVPATALAPVGSKSATALEAERRRLEQEVQDLRRERQSLANSSNRQRRDNESFRDQRIDKLHATVTKMTELPYDKVRVYLDNGQVWDTTDRGYLSGLKVGALVIVDEAMFGSHTIKVKDRRGALRVKRVR